MFELREEGLAVCRRQAAASIPVEATHELTPVYRLGAEGPLAVPSGRVFVRFSEGTSMSDRRAEVEAAGFEIDDILSYAPQAGWLSPRSGRVADALRRFPALARIAYAEAVEPQLLMQRAGR